MDALFLALAGHDRHGNTVRTTSKRLSILPFIYKPRRRQVYRASLCTPMHILAADFPGFLSLPKK